jgi:hypothetical protein
MILLSVTEEIVKVIKALSRTLLTLILCSKVVVEIVSIAVDRVIVKEVSVVVFVTPSPNAVNSIVLL